MNCKNCGARVRESDRVCPNCGAIIDNGEGYVSLSDFDDVYSDGGKKKKKKRSGLVWFLSILLTLAIIGGGAYYYFEYIYDKPDNRPNVTFEGGAGIINDDEKIVYVAIKDGSKIQYIHGVNLIKVAGETQTPVTSKYQYTKSINDSFRAIFFDTSELKLEDNNVYTFEIKLSFTDDDTIYTYNPTVTFAKDITTNVADIVFDHSVDGETTSAANSELTTAAQSTTKAETTTEKKAKTDFIYSSYWFTKPVKDGDDYTIFAIKFAKDGKFTRTKYYKSGGADWEVTTEKGSFEISDYGISLKGKNGTDEYLIDEGSEALAYEDGGKLSARKYNSVQNAEDFFGL